MTVNVFQTLIRRYCSIKPNYKLMKDIPGPQSLPLVGTLWKYFPLIGDFRLDKLHETNAKMLTQYGNIVKEEISPTFHIIHVFDPDDIEEVYKREGKYPARRSHLAVQHYRKSRPHLYNSGGLLPTNGNEWWRIRSTFQKGLSRIKDVRTFLPKSEKVIDEFLDKCIISGKEIDDFLPVISRLNLELMWLTMFGERLNCFEKHNMNPNSVSTLLMEYAETINCLIMELDRSEAIWTKRKTPAYEKLEKCHSYIESVVLEKLKERLEKIKQQSGEHEPDCLIDQYLISPGVDFKDVLGMAVDLVLGGVDTNVACDIAEFGNKQYLTVSDYFLKWLEILPIQNKTAVAVMNRLKEFLFATHGIPNKIVADNMPFNSFMFKKFAQTWNFEITSYTSSFLVYHLSNSPRIQEKLKDETSALMKNDKTVTPVVLNEATYTRAILKETFRLNPVAVGISRNLSEDTVLSGYLVPKGTLIITGNMVACRQEKYFKNPEEFLPERWIKDSPEFHSVSPYLILPFSHGPRTCVARRLAEQNLLTVILKIGQRYKLKWLGKEMTIMTPLICKPENPVNLIFTDWSAK